MAANPPTYTAAETAVPTLKVMRLQKPNLHMPSAGSLQNHCILSGAMSLPDSFGVIHAGETFSAYLGALNAAKHLAVRQLTIKAQLQTPSQRWHLASTLDEGNAQGGVDVSPGQGIDAIVSHDLEEPGQHILRVEVGYLGSDGGMKTLRKFYRFQVTNPLSIRQEVFRASEDSLFVNMTLEHQGDANPSSGMTIGQVEFEAFEGLTAKTVGKAPFSDSKPHQAASLLDHCGRLEGGQTMRYLFQVSSSQKPIAAGGEIGKAVFVWRKACGEMGRITSAPVLCPSLNLSLDPADPKATMEGEHNSFVVHGGKGKSGLSVDVAAAAVARATNPNRHLMGQSTSLDQVLPLTVEPTYPPGKVQVGVPFPMELSIVNHSDREMVIQLQFLLKHMKGLSVCGPSTLNLQELPGGGGSTTVTVSFLPLSTGLLSIGGCNVVDLNQGVSFPQPPLCQVVVNAPLQ